MLHFRSCHVEDPLNPLNEWDANHKLFSCHAKFSADTDTSLATAWAHKEANMDTEAGRLQRVCRWKIWVQSNMAVGNCQNQSAYLPKSIYCGKNQIYDIKSFLGLYQNLWVLGHWIETYFEPSDFTLWEARNHPRPAQIRDWSYSVETPSIYQVQTSYTIAYYSRSKLTAIAQTVFNPMLLQNLCCATTSSEFLVFPQCWLAVSTTSNILCYVVGPT